jgi:predicted nucleic acid-binding protein
MELIYKSEGREKDLLSHISHLIAIPNLNTVSLNHEIVTVAITLCEDYDLSFFDSKHVACALQSDRTLIGTDQAFKNVKSLKLIHPSEFGKLNKIK